MEAAIRHDATRDELQERWEVLCAALAVPDVPAQRLGRRLLAAWSRWPRHYHGPGHLLACLQALEAVTMQCEHPNAVAWALWFHDAVYWPWSRRNELRSAEWARDSALALGLPDAFAQRVHALVMATAHGSAVATATGIDGDWVVDIDLGVLGQPQAVYERYAHDVRREYFWVSARRFRAGRAAVLRHFLGQPAIYRTPHFRQMLEGRARDNLQRELHRLSS
jgi:predicted metal-dependent HD superfamily phosphohydrolase